MKTSILYLCLIFMAHTALATTDSTRIDQVRALRDAIYQRDKAEAAPFLSPSEKLFDLKFDRQFDKKFISSFLKLKTKELFEKGETETEDFTNDNIHFYKMLASYDAATGHLRLQVNGHSLEKDSNGEYLGNGGEYSCISFFKFKNGQLKFVEFVFAG